MTDEARDTTAQRSYPTKERLDATVRGRVQGVGFRYFVARRAMDLGLTGWVANEPDGSVRCVAEGARSSLEALLESLERGPAGALVDRVSSHWEMAAGGWRSFEVRSGGHRGD
ncbi:MAG TPA: acylphosphatase [Candidatus Limnocylindrales bacterium]|nr:acylphosphatase [Candidatus Limnocylindrales bacterium]